MNQIAQEFNYDVLVTGHNLDDEAAVLFGNTLHWAGDFMLRQAPVLPATPGFSKKAKPLCRFYEKEMAAYAISTAAKDNGHFAKQIYRASILFKIPSLRPISCKLTCTSAS
jgi:hypothetical protein